MLRVPEKFSDPRSEEGSSDLAQQAGLDFKGYLTQSLPVEREVTFLCGGFQVNRKQTEPHFRDTKTLVT